MTAFIPPRDSAANIANQAKASQFATGAQIEVLSVSVSAIRQNPHQPRRHFLHQELEELIQSIRQYGILQPLLVSKLADGEFELIAGERRLRAARIAGFKTVPVIVRNVEDLEKLELSLIENIQRSDLNSIEKADAYRKLVNEFGLNHEEAAKKLGISRSAFSNTVRLLDLPGDVQKAIAEGKLSEGHAKVLLGLPSKSEQEKYLKKILKERISVSGLTEVVAGKTKQRHRRAFPILPAHIKEWQEEAQLALGTKVTITPRQLQIDYYSSEELRRIIRKITGQ